jgi:hypothetical protein
MGRRQPTEASDKFLERLRRVGNEMRGQEPLGEALMLRVRLDYLSTHQPRHRTRKAARLHILWTLAHFKLYRKLSIRAIVPIHIRRETLALRGRIFVLILKPSYGQSR